MSDEPTDAAAQPVSGLEALEEFEEQASERIRSVLHDGRLFFSVIDVVGLLTDSPRPRNYWVDLKRRLADDEGFSEVHAKCVQLKMPAADGKQRLTDCADQETLLRIVQSIPSPKAEPLKQWLARVGAERLEEIEAPEHAADRMRQLYRQRGYTDEWIRARLQSIVTRDELTEEWRERGAKEGKEFAVLTEILHSGTFDVSTDEHRGIKALKKRENLRDNMTPLELALTILSEATATALHQEHDSQGMSELSDDARRAGRVGGTARRDVEAELGRPVVSAENAKTLTARAIQPELLGAPTSPLPAASDEPQGAHPEVVTVERVGMAGESGQQWAAYRDRSIRLPLGCTAAVGDRVTIYWRLPSHEGQAAAVRVNGGPIVFFDLTTQG